MFAHDRVSFKVVGWKGCSVSGCSCSNVDLDSSTHLKIYLFLYYRKSFFFQRNKARWVSITFSSCSDGWPVMEKRLWKVAYGSHVRLTSMGSMGFRTKLCFYCSCVAPTLTLLALSWFGGRMKGVEIVVVLEPSINVNCIEKRPNERSHASKRQERTCFQDLWLVFWGVLDVLASKFSCKALLTATWLYPIRSKSWLGIPEVTGIYFQCLHLSNLNRQR